MARIEGVDKVVQALEKRKAETEEVSVVVGYTAKYALWVHENREMKLAGEPRPSGLGTYWNPGRPGFLLDVMREIAGEIRRIVVDSMKRGRSLTMSLYLAGLRLQRESMQNVPVEYGFLRASAFTEVEEGEEVGGTDV